MIRYQKYITHVLFFSAKKIVNIIQLYFGYIEFQNNGKSLHLIINNSERSAIFLFSVCMYVHTYVFILYRYVYNVWLHTLYGRQFFFFPKKKTTGKIKNLYLPSRTDFLPISYQRQSSSLTFSGRKVHHRKKN